MLTIRLLSDLHLEHRYVDHGDELLSSLPDNLGEDVVCICGDLCNFETLKIALPKISKKFEHAQICYSIGNHECYSMGLHSISETIREVQDIISHQHLDNIWLMDNEVYISVYGDKYRIIGTTLWFPYTPNQPMEGEWAMNDFEQIKDFRDDVGTENYLAVKFLEENVKEGDIVMTHHLPSFNSVHPRYKNSKLNNFFVGGAAHIIRRNKPALWLHGHSHSFIDYDDNNTRVVCNPLGYPNEYTGFKNDLIIEVK